jgi:hypothetical protein
MAPCTIQKILRLILSKYIEGYSSGTQLNKQERQEFHNAKATVSEFTGYFG